MAGSGRRVFQPGEVLTASNVMNYLQDQSVMVFANTAARGSAIGTAVSEGMVTYQQDANEVTVYDGSVWKTVYPANASDIVSGTLAIGRGGTGSTTGAGLIPVIPPTVNYSGGTATGNSNGTIAFAGVTSISLNNVFSSTFRNYRIVMGLAASASTEVQMKLRVSGADNSANYYAGAMGYSAASANYSLSSNNNSNWRISWIEASAGFRTLISVDVGRPNEVEQTTINGVVSTSIGGIGPAGLFIGGPHVDGSSYDGFTVYVPSGFMTGHISVYGYKA